MTSFKTKHNVPSDNYIRTEQEILTEIRKEKSRRKLYGDGHIHIETQTNQIAITNLFITIISTRSILYNPIKI